MTSFPCPLSIDPSPLHSFSTKHPGKSFASSLAFIYQLVFSNCSRHNCNTITNSKFTNNLLLPLGNGNFFYVVSVAPDIIDISFHENHCFVLVWFGLQIIRIPSFCPLLLFLVAPLSVFLF